MGAYPHPLPNLLLAMMRTASSETLGGKLFDSVILVTVMIKSDTMERLMTQKPQGGLRHSKLTSLITPVEASAEATHTPTPQGD